ncbi:hypothetical protein ACTNC1_11285 [Atopobiaceae bacterium HCP3S3_A4]
MFEETTTFDVVPAETTANAFDAVKVYSTFDATDHAGKPAVFAAISDTEQLADHLDEIFNLENFVIQEVDYADEDGVMQHGMRAVLLGTSDSGDKVAYAALSDGITRSLKNIISIIGHPSTWPTPVPVMASEKRSRNGFRFMTLRLAL